MRAFLLIAAALQQTAAFSPPRTYLSNKARTNAATFGRGGAIAAATRCLQVETCGKKASRTWKVDRCAEEGLFNGRAGGARFFEMALREKGEIESEDLAQVESVSIVLLLEQAPQMLLRACVGHRPKERQLPSHHPIHCRS